ncbi:MAG: hypothetical protein ACRC02_15780 [Vogesella sp.]|uniref:hypothetical protein n=1 Tax=Vogesella sp. TaxID=1904252 RepID=UPI003F3F4B60
MNEGLRREVEISHQAKKAATRAWEKCADWLKAEEEASKLLRAELQAARDVLALTLSRMDAAEVANLLITLQEAKQ